MSAFLPLTAAQRGIAFAHLLAPGSPAYTTAELVEFDGDIDAERLSAALAQAYSEHEQLRVTVSIRDGHPLQRVCAEGAPRLEMPEEEPQEWIARAVATPFDLESGPIARTALWQTPTGALWFHSAHHLALDGFGYLLFARRVAALYRGEAPAVKPPTLAELIADEPADDQDEDFWPPRLAAMSGSASLAGRIAAPSARASRTVIDLPPATLTALTDAGLAHGVPWTAVAEGAFASYLWRFLRAAGSATSADESTAARIGAPQLGRFLPGGRPLVRARAVTTTMNVLPLSLIGDETLTVSEAVTQIAAERGALAGHTEYRQEDLARELSRRGGGQLFGPQVNMIPFDARLDFGEAQGTIRNITAGPVEDMTWCLRGSPGRGETVRLEVDANPALYPDGAAKAHAERLAWWLARFAESPPDTRVEALPLYGDADRRWIEEHSSGPVRNYHERTLAEAFRQAVVEHPDRIALRGAEGTWTYRELAERAGGLARLIRAQKPADGGKPWVVGVALSRSRALFVALYAVQLAGAAYLPLDPEQPSERLRGMVEDAEVTTVIADAETAMLLPERILAIAPVLTEPAETALPPASWQAGPDEPAYVLFTSGSTGRPKGVLVDHRAIDNRLEWMQDLYPLAPEDRVAHKTPISFDVSLWELFWPLRIGASVVIVPPGAHRDPRSLATVFADDGVTVTHFVPSLLRAFLADPRAAHGIGATLRLLFCSGEALDADTAAAAATTWGTPPINLYGPTEAAVDVTAWNTDGTEHEIPIGRPVPNTRVHVLDEHGRRCPPGMVGELCLAGVQLAQGYIGRDGSAVFVADPFVPGERMYRTGDRAQWREDGVLLYRGRGDDQLKIRGQRIELGEVRAAFSDLPGIGNLEVLALELPSGDTGLVCFFAGDEAQEDLLRDRAAERLTDAMRPASYLRVREWPFTVSGKTDRRALAALPLPEAMPGAAQTARDLSEQELCRAMGEVLGVPVGPLDDFFSRGGNSLAALRLLPIAEAVLGRSMELADVFAAPTARALVARAGEEAAKGAALEPVFVLRAGAAGVTPLITLPPAGGLGWCWAGLLRHLPAEKPVIALQADGMDGAETVRPRDLGEWARQCLDRVDEIVPPEQRIDLLGWSIGGMLAHEIAVQAAERGRPIGVLGLMDAYPAEQWAHRPRPDEAEGLRGLLRMAGIEPPATTAPTRESALDLLRRDGSVFAAMPPETIRASLESVLASAGIIRSSRHRTLVHDVLFFAAASSQEEGLDPAGWRAHIEGRLIVHTLDAAHGELVREPAVAEIAHVLRGAFTQ